MTFHTNKRLIALTLAIAAAPALAGDEGDAGSLCCPFGYKGSEDAKQSTRHVTQLKDARFTRKTAAPDASGLNAQHVQNVYSPAVHKK